MKHVWIVEIRESGEWHPTVGVGLSREQMKFEIAEWKRNNPNDKFRVKKYVGEEKK